MFRRHFVALAGAVLVAGCQSQGEDATPDETPAENQQSTQTPSSTDGPTETPSDTPTETDESTSGEDGEEGLAADHLAEAREHVDAAMGLYRRQGNDAETILDVGPATTGFDDDAIHDELDVAEAALERTLDTDDGDLYAEAVHLRTSVRWLQVAVEIQGHMSTAVEAFEEMGSQARQGRNIHEVRTQMSVAASAIHSMSDARVQLGEPSVSAFRHLENGDPDAIFEKDRVLKRDAITFDELERHLDVARDGGGDLADAQEELESGSFETAESLTRRAISQFRSARSSAIDLNRSFSPVVDVFVDGIDDVIEMAEEMNTDAQNNTVDSS